MAGSQGDAKEGVGGGRRGWGTTGLALACPCPPMHCHCWAEKGVYSGWKDTLGFKLSANVSTLPTLRMAGGKVKQVITLVTVIITLAKAQDLSCPKGSPVKAENFYVIGASGGDCKVDVIHSSAPSSLSQSSQSYQDGRECQKLHHVVNIIKVNISFKVITFKVFTMTMGSQ